MSESARQRHVRCYFGVLNLGGLMDMQDVFASDIKKHSQVVLPIFSTESYKIKTTFNRNLTFPEKNQDGTDKTSQHFALLHFDGEQNTLEGKFYQKKFRRDVTWDFGDGTKITGYSAEHAYTKPGRYKITCTFFDINRRTWVNDYSVYVIVKEIIPSILRFDDKLYDTIVKEKVTCSKIERICRIEALTSNTVKDKLQIKGTRIFTESEHAEGHPELSCNFNNLPKATFKHMSRYWTFLENTQTLFYNSDKVHSNYIKANDLFTPHYTDLYGRFFYSPEYIDELGEHHEAKIDLSIYQVIPYKHIDDNLKSIKLLDPNKPIIFKEQHYVDFPITQVYREEQMPNDVFFLGRRGYCDVFYKNDFIRNENVLSFIYDINDKNITGELQTSDNYLNINPIGMKCTIVNNDLQKIKIGISADSFLRDLDEEIIDDITKNYYIDPYFYNSLFKGLDIDAYLFPYIPYDEEFYIEGADDLVIDIYQGGVETYNKMYYVPKDFNISLQCVRINHVNEGNSSYINHGLGDDLNDEGILNDKEREYIVGIKPWFYRIPIVLQDYIDIVFQVKGNLINDTHVLEWFPQVTKLGLKATSDIVVPREKQSYEDVQRLLDVYMSHPMFMQTENLRDLMRLYLGKGLLRNVLTASDNFLDDTANVKTCYLSNLVSMLKMMGEDVTQFEKGSFDGVNDLKKFVRLLSMNHCDLVGHVITEDFDISIRNDAKGKNVGDEIFTEDTLIINNVIDDANLGKVISIIRKNDEIPLKIAVDGGVDLIVCDKYTGESRIVKFYAIQKQLGEQDKPMYSSIRLHDYVDSWGWNLLLPQNFNTFTLKIEELDKKINDKRYSQSQRNNFNAQKEELIQRRGDLVKGYYRFFLLNPKLQTQRIGNFLSSTYISDQIDDHKQWDEKWGVTHDVLMKILIENCFLHNNRTISGVYQDGTVEDTKRQYVTNGFVAVSKTIGSEIPYTIKVNGKVRGDISVRGAVSITGYIVDSGKNQLIVSTNEIVIDDWGVCSLVPTKIETRVNYDGTIDPNYQTFKVIGKNISGDLTVKIKGSVEDFIMDCTLSLDFVDERINNEVLFNSDNIFTSIRDYFFTNLSRQQLDRGDIMSGLVDNSKSTNLGRKFDVSLRFDDIAKLGSNKCFLDVTFNLGILTYNNTSSNKCSDFVITDHEVEVMIGYDGEISFAKGIEVVPIEDDQIEGSLYFALSGNAVLGSHRLDCYTYNPNEYMEDKGIKTLLVQVGGYDNIIDKPMLSSIFTVNGQDGLLNGYTARISSKGKTIRTQASKVDVDANVVFEIFNSDNEIVYTTSLTKHHRASIDSNGFIEQSGFIVKINDQSCTAQIVYDVFGGYYDLVGFGIELTLK